MYLASEQFEEGCFFFFKYIYLNISDGCLLSLVCKAVVSNLNSFNCTLLVKYIDKNYVSFVE